MALGRVSPDDALTDLIADLSQSLEEQDPETAKAVRAEWKKTPDKFSSTDLAASFAFAHRHTCKALRDERCVGCALGNAIQWGCMAEDEKLSRNLAVAIEDVLREYEAISARLRPAYDQFLAAQEINVKMRKEHWLPGEIRRRSVALRVRKATEAPIRMLRDVPEILLDDGVLKTMRGSRSPKGGAPAHAAVDFVADLLRRETGFGDEKVARLMGLTKQDVKRRRKKAKG